MRIATRLILLLLTIVMTLMGAYAVMTLARTQARVEDELMKKADHIGLALAVGTLHHLEDGDDAGVQDVVDRISHHDDVLGAAVFAPGGRLVAVGGDLSWPRGPHTQVYKADELGYLDPDEGGPAFLCAIRDESGALQGSLRMELREMSVLPYVLPERNRILIVIVALTAVIAASVYWITRRLIARPLGVLSSGAEAVGRGELGHRITLDDCGEISDLAESFNRMAENLEVSNRECVEERERIRRVVDGMPEGVVVLGKDGRVSYWNRAMETRFGMRFEEAVGRPLTAALPCAEDRGIQGACQQLAEGRKTNFRIEDVRLRLAPDRTVTISGTVLPDPDSIVREVVMVLSDTTERRAAELAVRESELRLRTVMDSVLEGIITIDANGTVRSINSAAQKMFGYAEPEIVGQNVRVLMPEPHASRHDTYVGSYLKTGEKRIIGVGRQVEGRRRDGSTFPMDLSVSEFAMESERMFTGTFRDITEKLDMEQQLQRSQQLALVGELAAGIAHEIGTPLNVISGTAEYLLTECGPSDSRADDLEGIREEVGRITGLVKRLMEFSRREDPRDDVVQLDSVLDSVLLLLGRQLEKASVEVKVAVEEALPPVRGDRDEIQQVLLNLVMNAWQVMPRGGQLDIRAGCEEAADGYQAVLRVADTGPGIPEEDIERLFEPFYTTKPPGEGTGLGLSIVRRIVDRHGGRITAQNRTGRGAVFELRIPAIDREA